MPRSFLALAVELPQYPRLADGEHQLPAADVDQHAFEDFVHVERFAGHVLEIPGELAVVGIQGHGRTGEERLVARLRTAADAQPGLGLRDAPVGLVEIGIVAAGDPGIAAGAQQVRKLAPGIAARLALARHGLKLPELLAAGRVVGADEAALEFSVLCAARQTLDHFSMDHDRADWCCCSPFSDRRCRFARRFCRCAHRARTAAHRSWR